ncbi:MAG: CoA pyrophosphatase [Spirochaetae bacterium HGW-Spirochaetae-5]|nr:MAG: CoA pyrophosphatase [Spirochaetae bacterium HGW-Spirochaetae-5]
MKNNFKENLKSILPATPGIHGRGELPTSVVMVLLTEINGEYHFVLEERNPNIRQGGEVCFPGGMFDEGTDASPRETALRETAEELGLPGEKIEIIGRLDTFVAAMGAVVEIFVGVMNADISSLRINRDEVEKVFTVPVSYFENTEPEIHQVMIRLFSSEINQETGEEVVYLPVREIGLPERYIDPWGNFKQNVYVFKTDKGVVWGLTAKIIMDLVRIIKTIS